jgi:hypothetical protein
MTAIKYIFNAIANKKTKAGILICPAGVMKKIASS